MLAYSLTKVPSRLNYNTGLLLENEILFDQSFISYSDLPFQYVVILSVTLSPIIPSPPSVTLYNSFPPLLYLDI